MELKNLKINFLGDSITQGFGCSVPERKAFPYLLAERYGTVSRNYGVGGTRISRSQTPSGLPKRDAYFSSRIAGMDEDADLVVVFGGTNDYSAGDAPFGSFEDRTPDSFCGALHVLFAGLMGKFPRSKIAVITPLHRVDECVPNRHGKQLKDYAEAMRRTAESYSLPVLDLFAACGIQPSVPAMRERYMPDGLHPNDAGHALLADRIAEFIEGL